MDVQCERCKTEYEFDDALVSGRGTTVRCANCGHQFKVWSRQASDPSPDRWVVRTAVGTDLTFLTLRELQRAIRAKQVGRGDFLTRGKEPPRTLGTITELEPFFEGGSSRPPAGVAGMGVRAPDQSLPSASKRTAPWGQGGPIPPARRKVDTLIPPDGTAPPPAPPAVDVMPATPYALAEVDVIIEDPPTVRQPNTPPPPPPAAVIGIAPPAAVPAPVIETPPPAAVIETPAAVIETSSPLPPPTMPARRISYADEELPDARRPPPLSSARDDLYAVASRRRVGGWIVAAVLMAAVGVVGWVVAKPYLIAKPANATAQLDPRALGFLTEGEHALADGNLDLAQGDFDKASALAEHDLRVLVDEARVAAARADVPWLAMKLLPPDAKDLARTTSLELDDRVARVRKAAEAAVAIAPEDVLAVRAHIDALRLAGDRDAARKEVAKIASISALAGQAAQPESAYVLAALDLAEPDPLWTTVIDRLRVAAGGEGNAGRARAALVYALAKSGDAAGAKTELAKLDAMARPYPLLTQLHAFVDKTPIKADSAMSALPQQPFPGPVGSGGAGAGAGAGAGNNDAVPGSMKAAQAAIKKGDWNRARQIYEALVARNPSDSEALGGLGNVARSQGDTAGAMSAYKRALAVNPSYLPALLGLADTQWASGDRGSALSGYKEIVDRFPEGTYPSYVKTRVEGGAPAPAPAGPTPTGSAANGK